MFKKKQDFRGNSGRSLFLIALFLLNVMVFQLLLGSAVFLCGGKMGAWQFPVALLLSAVANYWVARKQEPGGGMKRYWRTVFAALIIIIGSLFAEVYIYDTSWDGQGYHQESVYQLAHGWNPFYEVVPPYPEAGNQWLWVNHYPKALELCEAGIYKFTGKIETGKATNIWLWAAAFCFVLFLLQKLAFFSFRKNLLYTVLFTGCPVVVNQVFTYYIDGQMYSLLVCLLVCFVLLYRYAKPVVWYTTGAVVFVLVGVKFTSIVFSCLFTGAFLFFLLWKKQGKTFRKLLLTSFVSGAAAFFLVGFNPYMVSLKTGRHLFHPVMGAEKVEIMGINLPIGFEKKGRVEKFLVSVFAHTQNDGSWVGTTKVANLKVPFSVSLSEIAPAKAEDTRIAGFGPFFSGILLLSLFLLAAVTFLSKSDRAGLQTAWYMVLVLLASVLLVPEAWWARFVPQLWLIPATALFAADVLRPKMALLKPILVVLYVFFGLNISIGFLSIPSRWTRSIQVQTQLEQLRGATHPIKVTWGESRSIRIRLAEEKIPFQVVGHLQNKQLIVWSDAFFERPAFFPPPSYEPLPLKWLKSFKKLLGN